MFDQMLVRPSVKYCTHTEFQRGERVAIDTDIQKRMAPKTMHQNPYVPPAPVAEVSIAPGLTIELEGEMSGKLCKQAEFEINRSGRFGALIWYLILFALVVFVLMINFGNQPNPPSAEEKFRQTVPIMILIAIIGGGLVISNVLGRKSTLVSYRFGDRVWSYAANGMNAEFEYSVLKKVTYSERFALLHLRSPHRGKLMLHEPWCKNRAQWNELIERLKIQTKKR